MWLNMVCVCVWWINSTVGQRRKMILNITTNMLYGFVDSIQHFGLDFIVYCHRWQIKIRKSTTNLLLRRYGNDTFYIISSFLKEWHLGCLLPANQVFFRKKNKRKTISKSIDAGKWFKPHTHTQFSLSHFWNF